jgi:predicted MFS family arabinose efflux permease
MIPFRKVDAGGMVARLLLGFLGTAGLYYVNIMPALVDGLKQGLGFNNREAGLVGSANVYGAACGAFLIAFFVRRIAWRRAAVRLLVGLISMDLLSMLVDTPLLLAGARFAHGFLGGMLVGVAFAIIARTRAPDRTFGMLLLVQAAAGGVGVMALPLLVPVFGTRALFATLIAFSSVTMLMMQFLPDYPIPDGTPAPDSAGATRRLVGPLLLSLFSVFLFQAANMGLYAFLIGLGQHAGLERAFVSGTVGVSDWLAMGGSVLVIVLSTRFGIFRPIAVGMLLTVAGVWALFHSDIRWVWIAANVSGALTWNFVISYLLGMCARFDRTGQAAVWAGFASKMGLASGPMLASLIVGTSNYDALIALSLALLGLATLTSALPALRLDREQAA